MEADATRKDGDDLAVGSHPGREEYDRDEYEQRAEHIHEIRHEVDVIVEYDSVQRGFFLNEVIHLLAYVEDNDNADDKQQGYEESHDELLHYVLIYLLEPQVHIFL